MALKEGCKVVDVNGGGRGSWERYLGVSSGGIARA